MIDELKRFLPVILIVMVLAVVYQNLPDDKRKELNEIIIDTRDNVLDFIGLKVKSVTTSSNSIRSNYKSNDTVNDIAFTINDGNDTYDIVVNENQIIIYRTTEDNIMQRCEGCKYSWELSDKQKETINRIKSKEIKNENLVKAIEDMLKQMDGQIVYDGKIIENGEYYYKDTYKQYCETEDW